ncbi:MAG: hypothetical protein HKO94_04645 [Flavobacteriaceae bacterium]|nr:hypothetical protein [Flavobacteriaceae bacterium]
MQFKNPEILYALILLLIPVIVHLFQLRRFKKVPFTNVEFLKTVTKQTRKSQKLKKWLVLLTRMFLFACIILAFAQPFTSENNGLLTESETVIYLDNSYSMQAKGERGELLKRAVQDLLDQAEDDDKISMFTNESEYRNVSIRSIQNELVELDYTGKQLDYDAVVLKGRQMFSKSNNSRKNLVLISDFQQNRAFSKSMSDSTIITQFVQLRPVSQYNVSLDSVYIGNMNSNNMELKVVLNQSNGSTENIPISLYNGDVLMAKTALDNQSNSTATFTIPNDKVLNGQLRIDDSQLQFDNKLFFNINIREKTKVLSINESPDEYLKRVFNDREFTYNSVSFDQLNFNEINEQNLIILNELKSIPTALTNALSAFVKSDSYILIIPSINGDINTYNQLLREVSNVLFASATDEEKRITKINYSHPLYTDVFDQEITNFQYPKVNARFQTNPTSGAVLEYEDGAPFFIQSNRAFIFTSALNEKNSNMINSPLIVPTLYKVGRQSFKVPDLYYIIGNDNSFDVNTLMNQDDILKLRIDGLEFIPQQRTFPKKVTVEIADELTQAGIYQVVNSGEVLENVSFNHDREESQLSYYDLETQFGVNATDSVKKALESIKSTTEINALWKWFVIFALIFLIVEMLILKFLR